ncbi:MAG: hypothetical protein CTY15_13705 [Methylocystis sp.]|nr:MAG: hypothetical protein CTY15_13705 [Methylocystis sp.]
MVSGAVEVDALSLRVQTQPCGVQRAVPVTIDHGLRVSFDGRAVFWVERGGILEHLQRIPFLGKSDKRGNCGLWSRTT